jgi:photosystem II stability/assembly factor-like uncharacterized protein
MEKLRPTAALLAVSAATWLIVAGAGTSHGQDTARWTSAGIRGGPAYDLAVSTIVTPAEPRDEIGQLVFAPGTQVMVTDRGETWTPRPGTGVAQNVSAGPKGVAFVATASGEGYRTRDSGRTWSRITVRTGMAPWFLAVSPDFAFDKAAYALTLDDWRLYKTSNEGTAWQEVKVEVDQEYENAAVAYSPHHDFDETVLVATSIGVYRWTRDNRTWTLMSKPAGGTPAFGAAGGPASCQSLVLPAEYGDDPERARDPDLRTVFATNAMGVYRSDDDGETWTALGLPPDVERVNSLAVSNGWPEDPVLLVAVDAPNAVGYVSGDNGATWRPVAGRNGLSGTAAAMSVDFAPIPGPDTNWVGTVFLPGLYKRAAIDTHPVVVPPYNGSREMFLATDGDGVYRSTDAGVTWSPAAETFTNVQVTALAALGGESGPVLAGTENSGLYRSEDGGRTWSFVDSGLPRGAGTTIGALEASPAFDSDRTVFALHTDGLWASQDGGATWQKTGAPSGGRALAVSPAFATDRTLLLDGRISTDAGGTWSSLPGADAYPWSAAAFSPNYAVDGRIWWGTDVKSTQLFYPLRYWDQETEAWVVVEKPELSREQVYGLAVIQVDPSEPWRLFAATAHGVRGTLDGGEKWQRMGPMAGPMADVAAAVFAAPYRTAHILSAGEDGATWSSNRGQDWTRDPRSPRGARAVGVTRDGEGYLVAVPAALARLEEAEELLGARPAVGR